MQFRETGRGQSDVMSGAGSTAKSGDPSQWVGGGGVSEREGEGARVSTERPSVLSAYLLDDLKDRVLQQGGGGGGENESREYSVGGKAFVQERAEPPPRPAPDPSRLRPAGAAEVRRA